MPTWIWIAYGVIVVIGLAAGMVSWFYASPVAFATFLGGVFIISLAFFWLAIRTAGSLEPNRVPQE